jgi:dihydrofolate synthase/folylpolyglutamate synthase
MNYEESVRALLALGRELASPQQARVQKFGLENIAALADGLGNPHRAIPCAHIAGTNGKGSTGALLESILRAAGLRTGLYTSPHLERINERIRFNGENISDDDFASAWGRVHEAIESLLASGKLGAHPTFFECVTAMAFVAFVNHRVDFVVYEVGLGGRLDSTNIVEPEVAIITSIDFDHENFLGHSIEEIAREKAGIIKPGCPVVSSVERPEARGLMARRCAELGARLIEVESAWQVGAVTSADGMYRANVRSTLSRATFAIEPALAGRFQIRNALAAATAAQALASRGFRITDEAISRGIASVRWPGRLEKLADHPALFLDGAHNPSAARELRQFLEENFSGRGIVFVYGAMRDKSVDEIASVLFPLADAVILTQPRQSRAISAPLLAEMTAGLAKEMRIISDPAEALEHALELARRDDAIFVTGSLFLVGELRSYWHRRSVVKRRAAKTDVPAPKG